MKQMDECLDRAFEGKAPLASKKWKAILQWDDSKGRNILFLMHYHHLVLIYDPLYNASIFEWHETRTDQRGLAAAKQYLKRKFTPEEIRS